MKLKWKGQWKGGDVTLEASSVKELVETLAAIESEEKTVPTVRSVLTGELEHPDLSGDLGCTEAIREALNSPWGKKEPKTKKDLEEVFGTNGLYYPDSTLRGSLSTLNKKGVLRRVKKGELWGYIAK